ncbi:MAG TPA: UDP-2,3-diacylglucosamine diphosphatase [Casimicrobiaceae bacterium]|nr:UDP-2,3-diacylglucosamine diphosphatase [Casimicrobiaceae bacterium]
MKPRLFLSDVHLAPERLAATAAFYAFCEGPARDAAAVYILGDLFDYWIGDDQLADRYYADIAAAIRGVTRAGIPVFVAHGNRDFLLGNRFALETGARMLGEQELIESPTRTLISHGDELCTGDVDYQRYRTRMRNPATQRRLLRLPLFVRKFISRMLRKKSRNATSLKPESIMDVDDLAVANAFRAHGVTRMIHGHTHRPATHIVDVDGSPRERVVLSDWRDRGFYVEMDDDGIRRREIVA